MVILFIPKQLAYRLSPIYDIYMTTEQNVTDFKSLAATCKALSHPARLEILQTLALRGTCICGEIVDLMPLSQATVSQHLKILKNAGLITNEKQGKQVYYSLRMRCALDFLDCVESVLKEQVKERLSVID